MELLSNWHTSGRRVGSTDCRVMISHRLIPLPAAVNIGLCDRETGRWSGLTIDDVAEAKTVRDAMDEFIQRSEAATENS